MRDLVETYDTLQMSFDRAENKPDGHLKEYSNIREMSPARKDDITSKTLNLGYSSTQRDRLDSSRSKENGSKAFGSSADTRKTIITKKGTKKSFTLEEDKLLIRKLLEITNLNVKEISAKVVRDNAEILTQYLDRQPSSIIGRWRGYLQPIILSSIHGKLNINVTPEIYMFLISQKIKTIEEIDWNELLNRWPFQTEESLKLMVRAANTPGKTPECKYLHQRLGKLLPIKRKPTSAREVDLNNKIAEFYSILIKSDTLPQLSNKHSALNHSLNTATTSDIGMQCFEELIAQRRQTAFTS